MDQPVVPAARSCSTFRRLRGLYLAAWAATLLVFAVIHLAVISAALQWSLPASRLILGALGIMLVLIGNQLGKSRSMYLVGIRTPWTLASENVWIKTHRLGGKLMASAGALTAIAAFLPLPFRLLVITMFASLAIATILPVAYSFLLWRRESGPEAPR